MVVGSIGRTLVRIVLTENCTADGVIDGHGIEREVHRDADP
jgi:hypothetical protein